MFIIDATPRGQSWYPINHMVRLASRLFDADVTQVSSSKKPPVATRIGSIVSPRRMAKHESETCLLICASPSDLIQILDVPKWRTRFRFIAAWVIDSFWLNWIPTTIRLSLPFDHIFVTSGEDIEEWHRAVGIRPTWLPWGSDVLDLGSNAADRRWDLTRVGRQPPEWESDQETAAAAAARSITFHPRPKDLDDDSSKNYASLMAVYGASKFLLAFSNLWNPTNYTHPTCQYLTGRWVDALGCGAAVAGCAPRGQNIDSLLWPEATLELNTTDRDEGLRMIEAAVTRWTPEVAKTNYAMSLGRLDWRHRFAAIAKIFGESPILLADELNRLERRCKDVGDIGGKRSTMGSTQ